MRQIFSVRFFAAVGAVIGLFFVLTTIFATKQVIESDHSDAADAIVLHKIDLVEQIFSSSNPSFGIGSDGVAVADTELIIDGQRRLLVVAGTPGVDLCPEFGTIGACAVLADLLGDGVVWFALVPMGQTRTVDLPAIDTLAGGLATLVNGWQLPFASVLDRRCPDEFGSYREFRAALGDDFTSIYSIDDRRLTAVKCRTKVAYAPSSEVVEQSPSTTNA